MRDGRPLAGGRPAAQRPVLALPGRRPIRVDVGGGDDGRARRRRPPRARAPLGAAFARTSAHGKRALARGGGFVLVVARAGTAAAAAAVAAAAAAALEAAAAEAAATAAAAGDGRVSRSLARALALLARRGGARSTRPSLACSACKPASIARSSSGSASVYRIPKILWPACGRWRGRGGRACVCDATSV